MLIKRAAFLKSAELEKDFPLAKKVDLVFIGKSNVGKSSLINKLTNNKKLARVSKTPGCTKYINFFVVNEDYYIVDLPGYGFSNVPNSVKLEWRTMIENYLKSSRKKVIFLLIDVSRGLTETDISMIEYLKYQTIDHIVVYTKIDKLKRNDLREKIKNHDGIYVSSHSGENMERLLKEIENWL